MSDPRVNLDARDDAVDPNVVAAYVAGRLLPAERAAFEARLAVDPEAQWLVRALREGTGSRRRFAAWAFAAAALVVAGVGAALWARERPVPQPLSERLAAAAADLSHRALDVLAGFAPLSDAELVEAPVTRGGTRWISPRGTVLAPPTEIRLQGAPGAEATEVSILGPDLDWTRELVGGRAPAPPMRAGRYAVTLRPRGALAGQTTRATFEIAPEGTREAYVRARDAIRRLAPPDLVDLLIAHLALRRHLREEARAAAERASSGDESVRAEAARILRHVGE